VSPAGRLICTFAAPHRTAPRNTARRPDVVAYETAREILWLVCEHPRETANGAVLAVVIGLCLWVFTLILRKEHLGEVVVI
jgi:hypothetical protein